MTVIILSIIYPQQSESCGSFMVLIWDGVIAISSSALEYSVWFLTHDSHQYPEYTCVKY